MPSHMKGEPVWIDKENKVAEPGLWKTKDGKGYIAEVSYTDPHTHKRIREIKTIHRLDMARNWRQTRKADALRGEITRQRKKDVVLFKNFADDYFKTWSLDCKTHTINGERNRINNQLKPHFGKKALHTITRKDVEGYIAKRRDDGKSPATTNRDLCRIKNMLKKAVEWGHIDTNPAEGIKQAREYIDEADFLSREEVSALLDACADRIKPLLTLAVYTGMRWGELVGLEWRDVDLSRGFITLRDTKNHETRHVPINKVMREMLTAHRKQQTEKAGGIVRLLFPNWRTGNPYVDIRKTFDKALDKAEITRHFTFHGLRHTAASHMVMAGVDLRTVGKILGHKTAQITLRYAHLAPDYLKGAVDRLDYSVQEGREAESLDEVR